MKTTKYLMLTLILATVVPAMAQNSDAEKAAKKADRAQYSRWTVGVNAGLPFTQGDMTSFAHNKTYFGFIGGLQATYQLSPTFGLTWTGDYGTNKAGNKMWENEFILQPDGHIFQGSMEKAPAGSQYFKSLYTKENYFLTGLHFDINMWNLFAGQRQNPGRFTIIVSPGVYLQKFSPVVKNLSDDQQFASKLTNNLDFGFGGNVAFRYRASKLIDLHLKGNFQWIHNQNFDGIVNTAEDRIGGFKPTWYSFETNVMVGVIFKLGKKDKKDNLIWSTNRYAAPAPAPVAKEEPAQAAPAPAPAPEPTPAPVVEYETVTIPVIPAVHFQRDKAIIDREKYKEELGEIVSILNKYPEVKFKIEGYADKTGTESINKPLSLRRAEALKAYLMEKGISESRITGVTGNGVDTSFSGKDAFSVKARRAVVITLEKEVKVRK